VAAKAPKTPKTPPHPPAEEWRTGAVRNLQSARALAARGRDWASVYYHTGFSVEMMLKALRMKRDRLSEWPKADKGHQWHDLTFVARGCLILPEIDRDT
jgi:hypothetical protein